MTFLSLRNWLKPPQRQAAVCRRGPRRHDHTPGAVRAPARSPGGPLAAQHADGSEQPGQRPRLAARTSPPPRAATPSSSPPVSPAKPSR